MLIFRGAAFQAEGIATAGAEEEGTCLDRVHREVVRLRR